MSRPLPGAGASSALVVVGSGGLGDTGLLANPAEEMSSLHSEMKSFNSQLFGQLPDSTDTPKFRFYTNVWRPFADEFQDWYEAATEGSFWNVVKSQSGYLMREMWKKVQEYRERFLKMYESAKETGFALMGPAPTAPTQTPWDKGGELLGSIGSLMKIVIYSALGIGGVIAITSIVQNVRKDKDPLESYVALARMRGGGGSKRKPKVDKLLPEAPKKKLLIAKTEEI